MQCQVGSDRGQVDGVQVEEEDLWDACDDRGGGGSEVTLPGSVIVGDLLCENGVNHAPAAAANSAKRRGAERRIRRASEDLRTRQCGCRVAEV